MGRRYGMWDPYSVPESEKNKGSEIWLKARPEMKTHCVRADSSQALTSDSRSFVFLTDSSKSQGSHIPYLLCILSGRNSWLFPSFQNRSSFRNSSWSAPLPLSYEELRRKFPDWGTKNGKPESIWMRLSEDGDREFGWLWNEFRKIGTWESALGFTAGSVWAHAS